jgi:nicotinamide phosphoribosyltransferase
MLLKYGSPEWAEYAYHNFGSRSTTSLEHDMIAGYAHLTQFKGTDSFSSLFFCEKYYNQGKEPAGYSVLATEHSVTTMNGVENEEEFVYKTLLNNPNSPIISFVGDSYDIYKFTSFVTNPNGRIRQLLDKRENQKLVIRPDSGEPIEVLSKIVATMDNNDCFDTKIKDKLLSTKYCILWGDGITLETIEYILKHFTKEGYTAENFIFGSGTDLVNSKDRDTYGFAIKCSSVTLKNGVELDVFKDPITAPNKKSKRGRIETAVNQLTKTYRAVCGEYDKNEVEALQLVFEDGKLYNETSIENIRSNSLK